MELHAVWDTFWDLDSCRPMGFSGPGRIPWTAMLAHASLHGYSRDVFDFLWELIRAMDAAYLKYVAEKSKP